MRNLFAVLVLAVFMSCSGLVTAQDFPVDESNQTCIYFFYGSGCPHCARVEPFIEQMVQKYNLSIYSYEIYYNRSNLATMHHFFDVYNVSIEKRGIPVVFIGDIYYLGDEPILENLEAKIKELQQCSTNVTNPIGIWGQFSGFSPNEASFWVITTAAIVDSINPCAMSVLLILLTLLLSTGERWVAIRSGIIYISAVFIMYLLFGLGIFVVVQQSGQSYIFYKVVGALAVIIGVLSVRDYFVSKAAGKGLGYSVPECLRPFLRKLLAEVVTPRGAFTAGLIVTLIELPCTGGPYSYVLGMLAEKTTQEAAIPILIYYNIIFILPLVAILALVTYGFTTTEKAKQWKDTNMSKIGLAAGVLMIILGAYVLLEDILKPPL